MTASPIFRIGTAGNKQATVTVDGQWYYRVAAPDTHRWGPWIRCDSGRPEHAWYDPQAGHARLPSTVVDTRVNKDYYEVSHGDDDE